VQRASAMPHASPSLDWDLAESISHRLLASAPEVNFSFARQIDGVESRPSRLVLKLAGAPRDLELHLFAPRIPPPLTAIYQDRSQIPFPGGPVRGGSNVLTTQSQCAFRAFATARLGAACWEPAEAGLSARQRGALLHSVLHSVWSGPPDGIRSHADLLVKLPDLSGFVQRYVRATLGDKMPEGVRERMPQRYLALEETRLIGLVTEWLEYEAARVPFTVMETESSARAAIEGLELKLRLDRVDRLIDDSLLVIDYKTGDVSPQSWDLPRPDDVQLPLYAEFGLDSHAGPAGGLVFAKIRAGEMEFAGRVSNARATLRAKLSGNSNLVRMPLTREQLAAWRLAIETLALDFLAGRAAVDPRAYPETCENCGLFALCRTQEHRAEAGAEDRSGGDDAGE
jgi:ATP-dependent helicase/nuclease subunit B